MSKITATFQQLRSRGEKALIPFVSAGDPDLETTYRLVLEMQRRGADIIELGVPFSDPIADGPTIQKASQRALRAGASLSKILALAQRIRRQSPVPLVLMSYYNPIFRYGEQRFVQDAAHAGVDGVIIPDLPPEEANSLVQFAAGALDLIFLLAPTSTPRRIALISRLSQGFIYYVSLTGITGARGMALEQVREKLGQIRRVSEKPIAVGFGISNPQQAAEAAAQACGVIVGSALIRVMEQHLGEPDVLVQKAGEFVAALKEAVKTAGRKEQ